MKQNFGMCNTYFNAVYIYMKFFTYIKVTYLIVAYFRSYNQWFIYLQIIFYYTSNCLKYIFQLIQMKFINVNLIVVMSVILSLFTIETPFFISAFLSFYNTFVFNIIKISFSVNYVVWIYCINIIGCSHFQLISQICYISFHFVLLYF